MDYPMQEVQQHTGFRAVHPWQWWQWQLSVLASSSSPPAPSTRPPNHVSWDETGAAHIYSADLPGVKKEEIRVEIEDGRYLVIRTELDAGHAEIHGRRGSFARKFRLPGMVDADGITAEYAHGVLTVTVPRMHTRARPVVNLIGPEGGAHVADQHHRCLLLGQAIADRENGHTPAPPPSTPSLPPDATMLVRVLEMWWRDV